MSELDKDWPPEYRGKCSLGLRLVSNMLALPVLVLGWQHYRRCVYQLRFNDLK